MINVIAPLPPAHYHAQVRVPGLAFLAGTPQPTRHDWSVHRYWKEVHEDLYLSLGGICSYCATFTPRRRGTSGVDHTSIDHFIPKAKNHALAYEWSNFRLCRARLNNRKDNFQDVTDPYLISTGEFCLDFFNFSIYPKASLTVQKKNEIAQCLTRLELNTDDLYVNERARAVYSYVENKLSSQDLKKFFPFIASEMDSQEFDKNFLPTYVKALSSPKLRAALLAQGVLSP